MYHQDTDSGCHLLHVWYRQVKKNVPRQIVFAYAFTFCLFLPLVCINLRHSLFYVRLHSQYEEEQLLITENDRRLVEARRIISKYNETVLKNIQSGPLLHTENLDIALTVITVSRNRHRRGGYKPQYLTQVVGRLLDLLNTTAKSSRRKYGIFMCNVDGNPETYDEIKPLKVILPTFQKFKKKLTIKIDIIQKEKNDYVFCLEETLKINAEYAFLIEDDGYPHRDLLPVLERVVDSHLEYNDRSVVLAKRYGRNVTYVKFYHPERLLGYISLEWERIPELASIGFVIGSISTILYHHFVTSGRKNAILWIWVLAVIYFCLVALSVGRVNLLELRRLVPGTYQVTSAPSCCTPAMLFPKNGGRDIVRHLKGITCKRRYGKDIALEDVRRREGYTALMVQPNLFKHIGLFSTLRSGMIDPFIV